MDTTGPNDPTGRFELTGNQNALVSILSRKNIRLVNLFIGALMTLHNPENPEFLSHASHSLRELMEKIPQWYETVPAPEQLPRLNDKVFALQEKWKRMVSNTKCLSNGVWSGAIDQALASVLAAIEGFFSWRDRDNPMRKERAAVLFQKMDPMQLPLPTNIEESRVKEWFECRNYFVQVSHHNIETTPDEFAKRLYFLEGFLLDLVKPKTFEKHREIDAIVEQGERNAHA